MNIKIKRSTCRSQKKKEHLSRLEGDDSMQTARKQKDQIFHQHNGISILCLPLNVY